MGSIQESEMKIGIVGFGIGGATAAASMVRRGLDVTVFEQASEVREVGAGVATWPNTIRLLKRMGIDERMAEIGCELGDNPIRTPDGTIQHHVYQRTYDGTTGYYFHRAELLKAIASLVPEDRIRLGSRCVRAVTDGQGAELELENGEVHQFDVLIGADGIKSVTINAVTDATPPIYSNLAAYRGLVPNQGDAHLDFGTLWTDRKRYLVAFPVSGGRLINFVGVVPTPGRPDESWFMSGDKADLLGHFGTWDPKVRAIIGGVSETFLWGLYYREPLERIVEGRIALMGDAAHPMLIHAGQGVAMALEDGVALGVLLDGATPENIQARLHAYEQLRLPRATAVQTLSRRNAQFIHEVFPLDDGVPRPDRMSPVEWIVDYDVEAEAEKVLSQLQ
jgi:salicylate hydroxylase